MQTATFVSDPSACTGCHEISHQASPLFINHKRVNCIDCHSGKGIQSYVEARTGLLNSVVLKSSAVFFGQNISTGFDHSGAQANCTKCHMQPQSAIFNHSGASNCTRCHNISGQKELSEEGFLKKMGTGGHRNITCEACHTQGFLIPSCLQCHVPHLEGASWNNSVCLDCHNSPHIPVLNGKFNENIPKANCGVCHKEVNDTLEFYNSMHNQLGSCAICHPAHGMEKRCLDCHVGGHWSHPFAAGNCAGCHGKASCKDCHKEVHAPFVGVPKLASKEQFNDYAATRKR